MSKSKAPNSKEGHGYSCVSIRLKGYDYSQPGAYFVTILTNKQIKVLSVIENGQVMLSTIGKIVNDVWLEIPNHFPFVELGAYVIMPDHLHGIIEISEDDSDVRARHAVPLPTAEQFGKPVVGSLPSIIRSFKSEVTRRVNLLMSTHGGIIWHRSFYDHVIRNEKELQAITDYILLNPENWEKGEEMDITCWRALDD